MARFAFKKPVVLEKREEGQEIVTAGCRTVIKTDAKSLIRDLPLLLAMAKLAETDPLLVTFYFSRVLSEKEQNYARRFFDLCSPLREAWVWKILRKFATDIYDRKFEEILSVYHSHKDRERKLSDPATRTPFLGLLAVIAEGGVSSVPFPDACSGPWDAYVRGVIQYARREPETKWYCNLPPLMREPYVVKIFEDSGGRLYNIEKLSRQTRYRTDGSPRSER